MTDAIIVLGMHRSGTSCLTGCLKNFGLELGEVSDYNKYNKKGNQENKAVFRLNEALLKLNGGSWFAPPTTELLANEELQTRRDEVLKTYETLPKPWGIKDPRMLLAYAFWQDHLPKHALIGTFRHPKAVAQSLAARERLSIPMDQGYQLWHIYNRKLLSLHQKHQFPIVNFDLPADQYIQQVEMAAQKLELSDNKTPDFFDASLVSYQPYGIEDCPMDLLDTYKQLLDISLTD